MLHSCKWKSIYCDFPNNLPRHCSVERRSAAGRRWIIWKNYRFAPEKKKIGKCFWSLIFSFEHCVDGIEHSAHTLHKNRCFGVSNYKQTVNVNDIRKFIVTISSRVTHFWASCGSYRSCVLTQVPIFCFCFCFASHTFISVKQHIFCLLYSFEFRFKTSKCACSKLICCVNDKNKECE